MLFIPNEDGTKSINNDIFYILRENKIDMDGVSFKNVHIKKHQFNGFKNVEINIDEIPNKDLSETILEGVKLIGSLDGANVKQTSFNQILLCVVATVASLILGLFNINNSILFLSLAFVVAILSVLYTNIMLLPGLFAKTYVRKVKKVKAKEQKNQEKRLTEEQVMQETDLDNLVSN